MKKKIIILISVIVCLLLIIVAVLNKIDFDKNVDDAFGISGIEINQNLLGGKTLKINCKGGGRYSVVKCDSEMWETFEIEEVKGIGKNQIAILFADIDITEKLREKYPPNQVHTLRESPLFSTYNISIVYPRCDHFVLIVIGSNGKLSATEQNDQKFGLSLDDLYTEIKIPLK